MNYLPGVEVGARRLVGRSSGDQESQSWHDGLTGTRVLGGRAEKMGADLVPGSIASVFAPSSRLMLMLMRIIAFPKTVYISAGLDKPLT